MLVRQCKDTMSCAAAGAGLTLHICWDVVHRGSNAVACADGLIYHQQASCLVEGVLVWPWHCTGHTEHLS
jgi:hypothetical protein